MSESIPPRPSPEELNIIKRAQEDADPTTYSAADLKGDIEQLGTVATLEEDIHRVNPVIKSREDTYYRVQNGALQQAAARLLKGIINVSDVVSREGEDGPEFYSKRMPLDKIKEDTSYDEKIADLELVRLVLNDSDHIHEGELPGGSSENMNAKDSKFSVYDFGQTAFGGRYHGFSPYRDLSMQGLERLKEKLELLKARFSSDEGKKFVAAIYQQAVEKDSGDSTPVKVTHPNLLGTEDNFYYSLQNRIGFALYHVN